MLILGDNLEQNPDQRIIGPRVGGQTGLKTEKITHSSPITILDRANMGWDKPKMFQVLKSVNSTFCKDNKLGLPLPNTLSLTTSHSLSSLHLLSTFQIASASYREGYCCGRPYLWSSIQIQWHCPMCPQIQLSSSLSACGHRLQKKSSLLDYAHPVSIDLDYAPILYA